jgi:hypothetical protein
VRYVRYALVLELISDAVKLGGKSGFCVERWCAAIGQYALRTLLYPFAPKVV